jgi:hypothetical protein
VFLFRNVAPSILVFSLSACSAAGGGVPPSGPAGQMPRQATSRHTLAARFTLTIPKGRKDHKHGRYISPATKSMRIVIDKNAVQVSSTTTNVTPSSKGCAATNSGTQCTVTVTLAAGSYTASVSMYSGNSASGEVLSHAQAIPFTVGVGKANTVQLVLNGIPHSLAIAGADNDVFGSSNGFTLFGTSARRVIVSALDATGNLIVGPGAPTYTTSLGDGSGWTVGSTTAANPNAFSITPPGIKNDLAHVSVVANYRDDTCAQPGAVCTLSFPIVDDVQTLYVGYSRSPKGGADSVMKFPLPYAGSASSIKITDGIQHPRYMIVVGGTLYVVNLNNVGVYLAGSTTPLIALTDASNPNKQLPQRVIADTNGNVFVQYFVGGIDEFTGFSDTPVALASATINYPKSFAMNPAGDIFVTDRHDHPPGGAVYELVPPYTGTPAIITEGINHPGPIVVAPDGSLVVANEAYGGTLSMLYPFSGEGASNHTSDISDPHDMIFDSKGNLFVVNLKGGEGGHGEVVEIASPYTGGAIDRVVLPNSTTPVSVAVDDAANLYVSGHDGHVYIYSPPYSGTPIDVTASDGSSAIHVYVQ